MLLIVGTSIGGGMLALPVSNAEVGFLASTLWLIAVWAVMTFCAFLMLEVNLWFPPRNNIITMARATLGWIGEGVAWVSYLLLLYALLTAYISGGSALVHELTSWGVIALPLWADALLFVVLFGYIVYRGIQPVDYVNRALMVTKLGSLLLLMVIVFPFVKVDYLFADGMHWSAAVITVMVTSFGFANVIPTLRTYFDGDIKKLRFAILIGSLIPLMCYIGWNFAILGAVPKGGANGLASMIKNGGSATNLVESLRFFLQQPSITGLAHVFTVICVLTAFLGMALCLVDFLADGLRIDKTSKKGWRVYALTFLPPLAIVLWQPSIFLKAFRYAGLCGVTLVVLLPTFMAFSGRYIKRISREIPHYQVMGGKFMLILMAVIGLAVLMQGMVDIMHLA